MGEQLRDMNRALVQRERAGAFTKYAKLLALHRNDPVQALGSVEGQRAAEPVQLLLKTAVTAGSTVSPAWGSQLAQYQQLSEAFVGSLAYASAFDRIAGDAVRVPLGLTRIAVTTTAASGASPAELSVKAITSLALGAADLTPVKAAATVIISEELLRSAVPNLFGDELRKAVTAATNTRFLSDILIGVTPIVSSGATHANFQTDIAALLAALDVGATSRVYLIVPTSRIKLWVPMMTAGNVYAFPGLTLQGGALIGGIEVLVSDQLPANRIVAVVANGLVVASDDTIALDASRQALLQLDSSPDSPPTSGTNLVSLWQQNLAGLRAERFFAYKVARARSVAALSY